MRTGEAIPITFRETGITRGFPLPGSAITRSLPAFPDRRVEFEGIPACRGQGTEVMAQVNGKLTGRRGLLTAQGPVATTIGAFGILEE